MAAGSLDQSIGIWDARQGYLLKHLNGSEGHDASIYSIAFSPDNKFIISGGMDKKLKMWEISDKESKAMNTFEGHKVSLTVKKLHRSYHANDHRISFSASL